MAKTAKEELELKAILEWIFVNREDTMAMDQISKLAYPYSSKFKVRYGDAPEVTY